MFGLLAEDHSRSLRLRAVGIGSVGDGCELLAVEGKKFGSRRPDGSFLFFLKVILRISYQCKLYNENHETH